MDLHLRDDVEATEEERAAVAAVVGEEAEDPLAPGDRLARGGHAARARRDLLLPALQALVDAVGWVSPGGLQHVARRLSVPPADAHGVATFYALLPTEPTPRRLAHVCEDLACRLSGAERLREGCAERLGPAGPGGGAAWQPSPCLGLCEFAPAAWVQRAGEEDAVLAPADVDAVAAALDGAPAPEPAPATASAPQVADRAAGSAAEAPALADVPADPVAAGWPRDGDRAADDELRLLARVGRADPTSFEAYRAAGGWQALRAAVALGPDGVLRELSDAGLAGRGGAAFPTAVKWEAVAREPRRPHYLVVNADESEPGTFKDRLLLEHDPFGVVEAAAVAGLTTGCAHGYVYLRGEYPLAHARLAEAITQCRRRGMLGEDVLGSGQAFDLELRRGGGAYICGEETALFQSIEGGRGEPRNKPPFPTEAGLFGQPTVVNNVETLLAVLDVLRRGGRSYAAEGGERSKGTKLFCLSGAVARPGVYEVAFGTTAGELLDLAGGVADGRALQALLLGGAAGTLLPPDRLDMPLTVEDARAAGQSLGSGAVIVYDDRADLGDALGRIAAFFRDETCGQCVPCRIGTVRQEEALARLRGGGDAAAELPLLDDLAAVMADASICGLGQTAPSALRSALREGLWRPAGGR